MSPKNSKKRGCEIFYKNGVWERLAKRVQFKKGMPDFFYYIQYKADIAIIFSCTSADRKFKPVVSFLP